MALVSRIGTYEFIHDGQSIKLQSNLDNIRKLEEATGLQWHDFLDNCNTQGSMADLFYYMQVDSDETSNMIYKAFFHDVTLFQDPEFQTKIQEAIASLMGEGLYKLFKASKENSSPKK